MEQKKGRKKCALSAAIDLSQIWIAAVVFRARLGRIEELRPILGDTLLRLRQSNFAVAHFSRKKIFNRILRLKYRSLN
jgi:hypothetical protein